MNSWRVVRDLLARYPRFLASIVPLLAVSSFIEASPLIGFVPLVDLLIHPDLSSASPVTLRVAAWLGRFGVPVTLSSIAGLLVVLIVLKNLFSAAIRYAVIRLHFVSVRELTLSVLGDFLSARYQFFLENGYGVLGNTLLRETEKVGVALESSMVVLAHLLRIAAFLGAALFVSWKLTLMSLGLLVAALAPFLLLSRLVYRIGAAHTQEGNRFHGSVSETLNAVKLVLGYGNQERAVDGIQQSIDPYLASAVKTVMIRAAMPLAFEPVAFAIAFAVLYVGQRELGLSLSALFLVLYVLRSCTGWALAAMTERTQIEGLSPALEQVDRLCRQARAQAEPRGGREFSRLERGVVFKNASFAFGDAVTLRGVDLEIPKGKMTAVVGKSGCGKTTLLDLLLGLYAPSEGAVLVDGVPLSELDLRSWRRRVGYVPQEPFLFHATIRENLLWGREDASPADLERALEQANATEFTRDLKEGLDTMVGDRGVRLSVGQRQRIALARALLRKPELLILDEATSALDSQSERLIQESVERVSGEITVVAVAHRLSTIRKAHRIYLFEKGAVAESGTFEDLLRGGGEFLEAARLQGLAEPT